MAYVSIIPPGSDDRSSHATVIPACYSAKTLTTCCSPRRPLAYDEWPLSRTMLGPRPGELSLLFGLLCSCCQVERTLARVSGYIAKPVPIPTFHRHGKEGPLTCFCTLPWSCNPVGIQRKIYVAPKRDSPNYFWPFTVTLHYDIGRRSVEGACPHHTTPCCNVR